MPLSIGNYLGLSNISKMTKGKSVWLFCKLDEWILKSENTSVSL